MAVDLGRTQVLRWIRPMTDGGRCWQDEGQSKQKAETLQIGGSGVLRGRSQLTLTAGAGHHHIMTHIRLQFSCRLVVTATPLRPAVTPVVSAGRCAPRPEIPSRRAVRASKLAACSRKLGRGHGRRRSRGHSCLLQAPTGRPQAPGQRRRRRRRGIRASSHGVGEAVAISRGAGTERDGRRM